MMNDEWLGLQLRSRGWVRVVQVLASRRQLGREERYRASGGQDKRRASTAPLRVSRALSATTRPGRAVQVPSSLKLLELLTLLMLDRIEGRCG